MLTAVWTELKSSWTLGNTGHTACISFWIPMRQAISTDNGFIIKKNKGKLRYEREKKVQNATSLVFLT